MVKTAEYFDRAEELDPLRILVRAKDAAPSIKRKHASDMPASVRRVATEQPNRTEDLDLTDFLDAIEESESEDDLQRVAISDVVVRAAPNISTMDGFEDEFCCNVGTYKNDTSTDAETQATKKAASDDFFSGFHESGPVLVRLRFELEEDLPGISQTLLYNVLESHPATVTLKEYNVILEQAKIENAKERQSRMHGMSMYNEDDKLDIAEDGQD
jgi:hypothetical protein